MYPHLLATLGHATPGSIQLGSTGQSWSLRPTFHHSNGVRVGRNPARRHSRPASNARNPAPGCASSAAAVASIGCPATAKLLQGFKVLHDVLRVSDLPGRQATALLHFVQDGEGGGGSPLVGSWWLWLSTCGVDCGWRWDGFFQEWKGRAGLLINACVRPERPGNHLTSIPIQRRLLPGHCDTSVWVGGPGRCSHLRASRVHSAHPPPSIPSSAADGTANRVFEVLFKCRPPSQPRNANAGSPAH